MHDRRAKAPGATYFFTVVIDQRQNLFHTPESIAYPCQTSRTVKANRPFTLAAIEENVILTGEYGSASSELSEGGDAESLVET